MTKRTYTVESIRATGGAEIHRDNWPEVQTLVDSGVVRWATLARGPGKAWRRAVVTDALLTARIQNQNTRLRRAFREKL